MKPKLILLAASGLLLTACSGAQLAQTEGVTPNGSAFENELFAEYLALSRKEYREADYRDSDRFARRARVAASGEPVAPEALTARRLPANKVQGLTDARARLTAALAAGAAGKMPRETAQAQAAFDCWMQEQEENFQPTHIAACESDFLTAITVVEDQLAVWFDEIASGTSSQWTG